MDTNILKQEALPSNLKSRIAMNSILVLCMFSISMRAEVPCGACDAYHHTEDSLPYDMKYDIEAYEKKRNNAYVKSHKAFFTKENLSSSNFHKKIHKNSTENSYKNHISKENTYKQTNTKNSNLKQILETLEDYDA